MATDETDRRSLRDRVRGAASSVAGTLGEAAQTTAEGARQLTDDARQQLRNRRARQELESFRDDEVTDQQEARLQRARQEAQQEAQQEARQEFIEEYREDVKENLRDDRVQELRREFGLQDETQTQQSQQQQGFGMFGPPQQSQQRQSQETQDQQTRQRGAMPFMQEAQDPPDRDPPGAYSEPAEDGFELRFLGGYEDPDDTQKFPLRF